METTITFPHTYESGITVLKSTRNGAFWITDGLNVACITKNLIRTDGTLTTNGTKALMDSDKSLVDLQEADRLFKEKVAREKEERHAAWLKQKEEGSKKITFVLEQGVLMSAGQKAYKYACGKAFNMYRKLCTHYEYIPKSMMTVERKNCKVYVTLPKWLAEKHSTIFSVAA